VAHPALHNQKLFACRQLTTNIYRNESFLLLFLQGSIYSRIQLQQQTRRNQMKFIKTLLATLIFTTAAQATSLHPCTPLVQAMPSELSCTEGNLRYRIQIDTLMSQSIPICQGNAYQERKTAKGRVTTAEGDLLYSFTVPHDQFSYTLRMGGSEGTFKSQVLKLDLNDCVSPMHGGFSIGN